MYNGFGSRNMKGALIMTSREIIRNRLNHEGTDETPYTIFFEPDINQKLTEYYKDEHWQNKKLKSYVSYEMFVDTVGMKAVDDIYSVDAYGATWRMDQKPWKLDKPPLDEPDLSGYKLPDSSVFTNQIERDKPSAIARYEADNERYRVINMGWGVFEHTWRIRGFENALADSITDEDFYSALTGKITDLYIEMLKACADIPADAYLFGDDWGEQRGVIIGPERWRKFIKPCWERIYSEVHRQNKKVVQHSCGSISAIYDDLYEIGMDCHESVQPEAFGMEPSFIKDNWGQKISFWGCLGSQGILHFGSPAEIRAEIFRLHELFKRDGGYILAPAKPLVDGMKLENAVAVVEAFSELNN